MKPEDTKPYWLKWMLLNPFVYLVFYFAYLAAGVDNELKLHGGAYKATVTNVSQGGHGGKDANLSFQINGQQKTLTERSVDLSTKVGDQVTLIVLPMNPDIHETVGFPAGNKQQADLNWCGVFIMLVALMALVKQLFEKFGRGSKNKETLEPSTEHT